MHNIPLLPNVQQLAQQGFITGASEPNWDAYRHDVVPADGITARQQALLINPQTYGGLLISCTPSAVEEVLALFHREGFADAAVIGEMRAGEAKIDVVF